MPDRTLEGPGRPGLKVFGGGFRDRTEQDELVSLAPALGSAGL